MDPKGPTIGTKSFKCDAPLSADFDSFRAGAYRESVRDDYALDS